MIGIAAIVAQEFRVVASIVSDKVEIAIIIEVSSGEATSSDGMHKVRTQ